MIINSKTLFQNVTIKNLEIWFVHEKFLHNFYGGIYQKKSLQNIYSRVIFSKTIKKAVTLSSLGE